MSADGLRGPAADAAPGAFADAAQRRTVESAYVGGLTQPESAAAVGLPVSTVEGRIA